MLWTPRDRADRGGGYKSAVNDGLRALEKASFPTAIEWDIWWRHHRRRLEAGEASGWERALAHGIGRLMDTQLTLARIIRLEGEAKQMIRYNSDGQVYGEESKPADVFTREAFVWWLTQARPVLLTDDDQAQPGIPEWAATLAQAVGGAYIQQCRLGLEVAAVKRQGYLTVNASATRPAPTDQEIRDEGMNAFGKFTERDREEG